MHKLHAIVVTDALESTKMPHSHVISAIAKRCPISVFFLLCHKKNEGANLMPSWRSKKGPCFSHLHLSIWVGRSCRSILSFEIKDASLTRADKNFLVVGLCQADISSLLPCENQSNWEVVFSFLGLLVFLVHNCILNNNSSVNLVASFQGENENGGENLWWRKIKHKCIC